MNCFSLFVSTYIYNLPYDITYNVYMCTYVHTKILIPVCI